MATTILFKKTFDCITKQVLLSKGEFCRARKSFIHVCSSSKFSTLQRTASGTQQHLAAVVSGTAQLELRGLCTGDPRASTPSYVDGAGGAESQTTGADKQSGNTVIKVRSWPFHLTSPFGKLIIDKTTIPTRIVPANPHDYPAGDRVFVHLLASSVTKDTKLEPSLFQDVIASIDCSLNEQGISLTHNELNDTTSLAFLIEVPTCYGNFNICCEIACQNQLTKLK